MRPRRQQLSSLSIRDIGMTRWLVLVRLILTLRCNSNIGHSHMRYNLRPRIIHTLFHGHLKWNLVLLCLLSIIQDISRYTCSSLTLCRMYILSLLNFKLKTLIYTKTKKNFFNHAQRVFSFHFGATRRLTLIYIGYYPAAIWSLTYFIASVSPYIL